MGSIGSHCVRWESVNLGLVTHLQVQGALQNMWHLTWRWMVETACAINC